jgi:MFS family permease
MCACVLFAYWGLFTWIPAFLSSPLERGGAGLGIVRSTAWIIPTQIGAFFGYTTFGVLADRWGRRPVFVAFVLAAALLVPIYGLAARSQLTLMVLGPLIGFFGHGYFSVFGALLAELFPSSVRATAQGIAYNSGRAASAFAPLIIGAVADRTGIGVALGLTSAFFVAGGIIMLRLPETKGEQLQ